MIETQLFEGTNIHLTAVEPEQDAAVESAWTQDLDYIRKAYWLKIAMPLTAYQLKKAYEDEQKETSGSGNSFQFSVRIKDEDQLIGFVKFFNIEWTNGNGFIQVAFCDEQTEEKYGKEVLMLGMRYVFCELNLKHLITVVPGYEEKTIALHEQQGFTREVCQRGAIYANGRYWDRYFLGCLQEEWAVQQMEAKN